ncbi:hypothetical protein ANN_18508 [Periplaneta americana]|uniref:Uncharacterized protein n=1 Tax=Periplaneta americana TaxID=6978 RepID=A0ABQ8SPK8_PERAM|nr:hypothetical protein ANN_18508 [Periplaneta americana]
MPHRTTINSDGYVATLKKLQVRLSRVRRHREKQDVLLLHDNAQPYKDEHVAEALERGVRNIDPAGHHPKGATTTPKSHLIDEPDSERHHKASYGGWINFENETQDRQEWRNAVCERGGKDSGFSYDLLDGARTIFRGMVLRDQPGEYCR